MRPRNRKGKYNDSKNKLNKGTKQDSRGLLDSVNKIKDKIRQYFHSGQPERADQWLGYLRENQQHQPKLLAKSLSDLANQISDNTFKLKLYHEALELSRTDAITLASYGTALANANESARAFALFERSLAIKADEPVTLNSYGTALANANESARAFVLFERSLAIHADDPVTLTSYGTALANANQLTRAFALFERSLAVEANNAITLMAQAFVLEKMGQYQRAVANFKKMDLDQEMPLSLGFIYLNLGRLEHRLGHKAESSRYFEQAMGCYEGHPSLGRLTAAKQILVVNPYSEEAIEILRDITPHTPGYQQALRLLSLNLDAEGHFDLHNDSQQGEAYDPALLNRGMYHKIQNEISILKGVAQRIIAHTERQALVEIVAHIEEISVGIEQRRRDVDTTLTHIPAENYQDIIDAISDTAQNIADFVNNEMAIIKGRLNRMLQHSGQAGLQRLFEQVEFTESALNDLKAVNEGVALRMDRFPVACLFENWEKNPCIENAEVVCQIDNTQSEFYGDEQKIKAFLKELVDNAIKHNAKQTDLRLRIHASDIEKLPESVLSGKQPVQQTHLKIVFTDNGKGIPDQNKNWIFLPMRTTSPDGSGLGLFLIKRTVTSMRGYILETGQHGSRFELYLPYGAESWH